MVIKKNFQLILGVQKRENKKRNRQSIASAQCCTYLDWWVHLQKLEAPKKEDRKGKKPYDILLVFALEFALEFVTSQTLICTHGFEKLPQL